MGKKILLTGPPGCGKTTVIQKLSTSLTDAAGFLTKEISEGGVRKGFRLVDIATGEDQVLSHVDIKGSHRVGRYGVDVENFESFLERLNIDAPVLLIDEIGKMECLSPGFRTFIEDLLGSDRTVIATIAQRGTPFIESLKRRPGIKLITVTTANRNALPKEIINMLNE